MQQTWKRLIDFAIIQTIVLFCLLIASDTSSDPLNNWTQNSPKINYNFTGISYGNNIFVVVGYREDNAFVLSSPDGIIWTQQASGKFKPVGIAYGIDTFIAVSKSGAMLKSPDGIKWTIRMPKVRGGVNLSDFEGITFVKDRFVAFLQNSPTYTSFDGINWDWKWKWIEQAGESQNIWIYGTKYGNKIYVGIGAKNTQILTSTDGINWILQNASTTKKINGLAFGNDAFVAVGDNGTILTSTNGINWTSRDSGVTANLLDITYGNNRFIAVGENGTIIQSAPVDEVTNSSTSHIVPPTSLNIPSIDKVEKLQVKQFELSQIKRLDLDYEKIINNDKEYLLITEEPLVNKGLEIIHRILRNLPVKILEPLSKWNFAVISEEEAFGSRFERHQIEEGLTVIGKNYLKNYSQDEIAFIIAHEVAHAVMGHYKVKLDEPTEGFQRTADKVFPIPRKYYEASLSREQEKVADDWAITYMRMAGFNPEGALSFFEKKAGLQTEGKTGLEGAVRGFLKKLEGTLRQVTGSPYPEYSERIENIKHRIENPRDITALQQDSIKDDSEATGPKNTNIVSIDIQQEKTSEITEGILLPISNALLSLDGKTEEYKTGGYINKDGKVLIEKDGSSFSEGLAAIWLGGHGYIDKTGKMILGPFHSDYRLSFFSEGMARIYCENKKRYGYIDNKGNLVIKPQFIIAQDFSEGLALVISESRKYGYIDKTGKFVIRPLFDYYVGGYELVSGTSTFRGDTRNFSEGLAPAPIIGEKWGYKGTMGYIDITGKFVIEPQFDFAGDFSEGLAAVKDPTTKTWGYIDKTGKFIIEPQFSWAWNFSEDLAFATVDKKSGYINKSGKFVSTGLTTYSKGNFSEGMAPISINGKWGYIDKTGHIVIEPQFFEVYHFWEGVAEVWTSEFEYGYINKKGEYIWGPRKVWSKTGGDTFYYGRIRHR